MKNARRQLIIAVITVLSAKAGFAQGRLAQFDIPLLGITATTEPANPVVPKSIASAVRIVLRSGTHELTQAEIATFLGTNYEARAELSGPGLTRTITLPFRGEDNTPSDPLLLPLPALAVAGDYNLSNIRIVSPTGAPILDVRPRNLTIKVIDQILITSVTTRALTLDEIREKGIVLDSDDYLAFEFTIGLALESKTVNFSMPVVFTREGVPIPQPIVAPPAPPRQTVTLPNDGEGSPPAFYPTLLEIEDINLCETIPELCVADPVIGGGGVKIPALLVIPGNTGYLKQFFSAQLFVANGAPPGSGLFVRDITGTIKLPPGEDRAPDTDDDPLALPEIERNGQVITQPLTMSVRGVGPDGIPATADDEGTLGPGQQGQGEFLLRGEKEGFHTLDFDIEAVLDGLPVGPVKVTGKASGGVLVRNPFFDMTFTVPAVIRRGEPFKVYATVSNIGQGIANDVSVTFDAARLSGATLVGDATRHIDTLRTADAKTLAFDFIAERTGQVVASYLQFEPGAAATGTLKFALGIGERGIALSPDTLVLPADVDALPIDLVDAAMRVLGQAWSIANAPANTLPLGVVRISKTVVTQKALALAEAGLRVTLGQASADATRDLVFDFYGGDPVDPGFDQLLRQTEAGHHLARTIGALLADAAATAGGASVYEQTVAEVAASGRDFISFALSTGSGAPSVGVSLTDAAGHRSIAEGAAPIPTSQVESAVMLPLGAPGASPILGVVAAATKSPYAIELVGSGQGSFELAVTLPRGDGTFIRGTISDSIASGALARVVLDTARPGGLALEKDFDEEDGTFASSKPLSTAPLVSAGPRLVSATIVGPETLGGASPFGFNAALLFDRVVNAETAEAPGRYTIPDNAVQNAKPQLSGRLVFASLEQPEGPYVPSTFAASGVTDLRGKVGPTITVPLQSRLADPGAVVSGRVFNADGTPVTTAIVTYLNNPAWTCPSGLDGVDAIAGFASVPVRADGSYEFRYVRQDTCGFPWAIRTRDPVSGALRSATGFVRAAGEHIVLDIAVWGRGTVAGTIRDLNGQPVPGANVGVFSYSDAQEGVVGTADGLGRYALSGVPVGQVSVRASKGISAGYSSGRLDRAGTTATIDVTLDGGTVDVSGTVRQELGTVVQPARGALVYYSVTGSGPLAFTTTDGEGKYSLKALPIGSFRIDASMPGQGHAVIFGVAAAGDSLTGQDLVIVVPQPTPGDEGPGYGTVRGVVRLPNGAPAEDVLVSIGSRGALSKSDGTFEIIGVAVQPGADQAVVARSRDGKRSGSAVARVNQSNQIVEGISIVLSGVGSVVFTVRDAAGNPVGGQVVGLLNGCSAACGCSPKTTGPDGTVKFDNLPIGRVSAKAVRQLAGFIDVANASAVITSDGQVAAATLQLRGFGSVVGAVKFPNGDPALGAYVDLTSSTFDGATCELQHTRSHSVRTGVEGTFEFPGVGVGPITVTTSHLLYPITVSGTGAITANGQQASLTLTLAENTSSLSGELSGIVFLPDGITPAGAGVDVIMNGPLPDVIVRTNAEGRYKFAKIFPAGTYTLTVRDPVSGGLTQQTIFVAAAVDATHNVRLKGKAPVKVRVVDAAGDPIAQAVVRLRETTFPQRLFEGVLDDSTLGLATFVGVFEGPFSVEVADAFARGGRASGAVVNPGELVEVTVVVTTTGTVRGHFYMPDGTTPIPFATVALTAAGRTIGQTTTLGTGDIGAFEFDYVPAGPVQVSLLDPATARTGFAAGTLQTEGQVLEFEIRAQSLGVVTGLVTSNDVRERGANVVIVAGAFMTGTTTDSEGRYRVTGVPEGRVVVMASLGEGFLTGTASSTLSGEGTVLTLDVALRDSGTVTGQVLEADNATPAPPAQVSIQVGGTGGGSFTTTTDGDARFRFDRVPAGLATLTVDLLGSIDEARSIADVPAGETVDVTLRLNGVGSLSGTARDASDAPIIGDVSIDANEAIPFHASIHTGPDGQFTFPQVPAGVVTLSLVVGSGNFALYGTSTGTVLPKTPRILDVKAQASGIVAGRVLRSNGVTPTFGAETKLVLDGNRGTLTLYTDSDGRFEAKGIPLGAFTLRVRDQFSAGVALVEGRHLDANGQRVEVGDVTLDDTEVALVSVDPPDGSTNIPVDQMISVRFSDPLASAEGVVVRNGAAALPLTASLSPDRLTVQLSGALPSGRQLEVLATTAVTDIYGRHLIQTATSRFTTTAPVLVSISVTPSSVTLIGAGQQQLVSVIGHFADGSQQPLTSSFSFVSSNPAVASVDASGLITSGINGTATIAVSAPNVQSVPVAILVKSPVTIVLAPASFILGAAASTQALTVTLTYSDGSTTPLTTGVSFSSSDTAVATVNAAGVVTSVAAGQATITATLGALPPAQATVMVKAPVLSITKTHADNFTQGQHGATFTVIVSNASGAGSTSGEVTVTETLPDGLTFVSMVGNGWQCPGTSCSRSDVLTAGNSYPPITVTVDVEQTAASPQINSVSVAGGGSAGAGASDTVSISPPFCAAPVADLVGWWPGESSAADLIGGNDGTLESGTTFAPGRIGSAFSFNGTGAIVTVPDSPVLDIRQNLTVSAWFNVASIPAYFPGIVTKGPTNAQYLLFIDTVAVPAPSGSARVCFRVNLGPDSPTNSSQVVLRDACSTTPVTYGQFMHVAGTYDGTALKIYINGTLERSTFAPGQIASDSRPLTFGAGDNALYGEGFQNLLHGLVDEVQIYGRALTDAEVGAVYARTSDSMCPVLNISKTHAGNFTQGQQGATYTVTINSPAGGGSTVGAVTVSESVPTGLTLVSMAGIGWQCADNTCTRNDTLLGGSSYPPITVTVDVASNAPSQVVNTVGVSGGGAPDATATDATTIVPTTLPPSLSITKTHTGNFTQGQQGVYTVTVSNAAGAGATNGMVTVTETPPAGLTIAGMSGPGWQCSSNTCTRSNVVAAGESYPPISVTVNVALNATSPAVNVVGVSGGGSASANASDSTSIVAPSTTCTPAPAGLVGWWPANGAAVDIVSGNTGILNNGVSANSTGFVGLAFAFDGVDDYVRIPNVQTFNFAPSEAFTLQAWVRPESIGNYQAIIVKSPTSGYWDWGLYLDPAGHFLAGHHDGGIVGSTSASAGAWYHVSVVYQNGSWTLYVNGVKDAQASSLFITQSSGAIGFGRKGDSTVQSDSYKGALDEVQLFNRSLSAGEIESAFAAGSAGLCSVAPITMQVANNAIGNQAHSGVGVKFSVNAPIIVSELGIFDSGQDGIAAPSSTPLSVYLLTSDGTVLRSQTFENTSQGTLDTASRYRFKTITPLTLGSGVYVLAGYGWTSVDLEHNCALGGTCETFNTGGGLLTYLNSPFGGGSDPAGMLPTQTVGSTNYFSAANMRFVAASGVPDTTRPAVTEVSPVNGAAGVAVTAPITVTFSETVNPATVTTASLPIRAVGVLLAGTYVISEAVVTFTPVTPLPAAASISITVNDGGVLDLTGNGTQPFSSSFTTAAPPPALTVTKAHTGNFTRGQQGVYTVTVSNAAGAGATNGTVTVTEAPPAGLTIAGMTGPGWQCSGNTCTRSDALAAGGTHPAITVTVNVLPNATSPVVNAVSVSGGGSVSANASDPAIIVSGPPSCVPAPAGLISWWSGNGTANDLMGLNNPSSLNAVTFVPGKVGLGFALGTGGFADIAPSSSLANQRFAITAWARSDGPGPNEDEFGSVVFGQNVDGFHLPAQINWRNSDQRFIFLFGEIYTERIISQHAFLPGQFYFVAATYDGVAFKLFVNGSLEGSFASSKAITYSATNAWSIGSYVLGRPIGLPRTWNGVIDEVQIFNRALSDGEIQAIFAADTAGICQTSPLTRQILNNFNETHLISDVVHVGDNQNDSRFLPPNPIGPVYAKVFTVATAPPASSTLTLKIDQYQADNSTPANRSFVTLNGTRLGFLSVNSFIADLAGSTTLPVVTDTFAVPGNLVVAGANTLTVEAGNEGGLDDLSVTNIRLESLTSPALNITKSHSGSFLQGQQNAEYVVTVSNIAGAGPTVGVVTVSETIPTGMTISSMSGDGWQCVASSCSRIDSLVGGNSYPPILVKVNVAPNTPSPIVNSVSVTVGAATSSTTDPTIVVDSSPPPAPDATKIFAEPPDGALSFTYGIAGAVEGDAVVEATNTNTGVKVSALGGTDGSFSLNIAAEVGHVLSLVAIDAADNRSLASTTTVRNVTSLPPGPATLRFEGAIVDRVGVHTVESDGQLDAVFTVSFAFGEAVTRQLSAIDLEGPAVLSTRPGAGVLGVASDLGAPLKNAPDGSVSFPVTSSGSLVLFAGAPGFVQQGATYKVTVVFTNGSRYIGSVTLSDLPTFEVVGSTVSILNVVAPAIDGDAREVVGPVISLVNVVPPEDPETATPKESVGQLVSIVNLTSPATPQDEPREVVGSTLSIANLVPPPGEEAREVAGPTFTVLNTEEQTATSLSSSSSSADAGLVATAAASEPLSVALAVPTNDNGFVEGQTVSIPGVVSGATPGTTVAFLINGQVVATDATPPYELLFTAPSGIQNVTIGARATDAQGQSATADPVEVPLRPDPLTTISGRVVDSDGNPVAGATVELLSSGLQAEFFDVATPPMGIPDISTLQASSTRRVTALNWPNPNGVTGFDPFGTNLAPDYAARFGGSIAITTPGPYSFFVRTHEGARLKIGAQTVIDLSISIGDSQESFATVDLAAGVWPLEVTYFESAGNSELVLSYAGPDGERRVVPSSMLVPARSLVVTTDASGTFLLRSVPTALDNVQIAVTAFVNSQERHVVSEPLFVRGSLPEVHDVVLILPR